MVEFRRAAMELRSSIEREINLEELQDTTRSISREVGEGVRSVKEVAQQAIPEEIQGIQPSDPGTDPRNDDAVKGD